MKQGTISVLFGSHSVGHSILVYISWVKLYRRLPLCWETICIFLHDVGHWGKNYSDDLNVKREHWKAGARIAGRLFGRRGFDLVAGHDGYSGFTRSLLYKPDKYSWYIAPYWWLWLNNIIEPYISYGMRNRDAVLEFQSWVKNNIESGEYRSTHDAHTERKRRQNNNGINRK